MFLSKLGVFLILQVFSTLQASIIKPRSNIYYDVQMPEECEKSNKTYCFVKLDNDYEQEQIDELASLLSLFEETPKNPVETGDRGSVGDEDDQPCRSKPINGDLIQYIKDINGAVRRVIQSENYKQKPGLTECKYVGPLKGNPEPFRDAVENCRYDVRCVEKRVPQNIMVLNKEGTYFEMVEIMDGLPMACVVEYSYPPPKTIDQCYH